MSHADDTPSLVILAAGIGSRYGDAKQVADVGPDGEWMLEYSIHDALAAGFTQFVMVTRAELREVLQQRLAPHLRGHAALHFVEQTPDRVPTGCDPPLDRRKPLGTGHALWCCAELLHGPFAVINADDYYGRHAFHLLAEHLRNDDGPAMVGYRLDATLSEYGGVNRGICRVDRDGFLEDVTEYTDIAARQGALAGTAPDGSRRALAPDSVVSLNCWGLLPDLLPDLETGLREFLSDAGANREYYLPHAISRHLATRERRLAVLPTDDSWLGLTYPDDREHAITIMAMLHARGAYPMPLWPRA
ncbi:MAG: nucleotidyltransferase family protein [Rhodanobacteraceae bacterium]